MSVAIFFGSVTILLFFVISIVTSRYEPDRSQTPTIADRFLEKTIKYDANFIQNWIKNNPKAARSYVFPVLFPLDLMFMIFLGGFLGLGSITVADEAAILKNISWVFAIMPASYIFADLIEDILIARLLLSLDKISDSKVLRARTMSNIKLVTCIIAISQTIIISGIAVALGH